MPVTNSTSCESDSGSSHLERQTTSWNHIVAPLEEALKDKGVEEGVIQAALADTRAALVSSDEEVEKECPSPGEDLRQTICQIENVPQEAVDFAFDQMDAKSLDQVIKNRRQPLGGEIEYDYENQRIVLNGRTVLEQCIIESIDEKLSNMMYEVEHGEREDYTRAELHEARKSLCVTLNEEFSNI